VAPLYALSTARRTLAPSLSAGTTTENRSGSGGETCDAAHGLLPHQHERRLIHQVMLAFAQSARPDILLGDYAGRRAVCLTDSGARDVRGGRPPHNTTTGGAHGFVLFKSCCANGFFVVIRRQKR
jgi:hypothetical protein